MSEAEDTTTTLAEDLGEAFDEVAEKEEGEGTEEGGGPTEDTAESVGDTEASEDDSTDVGETTDDEVSEGEDDDVASETEGDESDATTETVSDTPAPASWSPENREHWGKLPTEVQEQVAKREREIDSGLREASDARRFQSDFAAATQPFQDTIAVEAGGDAILATRNLMNIATGLRVGAQPQKAQLIAQIIQSYGVDVETLDQVLSSQIGPQAGQPQAPVGQSQQFRDPRVDQMLANQQRDLQESDNKVQQETAAFLQDPANEFAMDLRNDMADLMEMAAKRNETLDYKSAYDRAVAMSPAIQQILATRKSVAAGGSGASLKRKKRASRTINGTPSGDGTSVDNSGTSMSQDVNAAWDSVTGGDD